MSSAEELALRQGHALYNAFCQEDDEDVYGEFEYDPYEEAEALYGESR